MRSELERLYLLEQQLLGGPAALAVEEWHVRQLLDGDLAVDAEVQQHLYQGLRLAGRQQLHRELKAIHKRLYAPRAASWLTRLRSWWVG